MQHFSSCSLPIRAFLCQIVTGLATKINKASPPRRYHSLSINIFSPQNDYSMPIRALLAFEIQIPLKKYWELSCVHTLPPGIISTPYLSTSVSGCVLYFLYLRSKCHQKSTGSSDVSIHCPYTASLI